MKLLLIEDESVLHAAAAAALRKAGYLVDVVECLADAASAIAVYGYDLVLLDRNLPDGDGLTFLRDLRRSGKTVPIIIMSAVRQSVVDRVEGLDLGADDYLLKPVDHDELLARIRTLLRRPKDIAAAKLSSGNVTFEMGTRCVQIDGQPIRIARRELGMLELLIQSRGRIISREQIEQNSYGFDEMPSINAIDVSIHRLRRLLVDHGATVAVTTVRGIGYMLTELETSDA